MPSKFKTVLDTAAAIFVVAAASALLWRVFWPASGETTLEPPLRMVDVTSLTIPPNAIRHVRGDGRVALVEFSDYECAYCARHAQINNASLKKDFVDSGMIHQIFINFPLEAHQNALLAAHAAECAAQSGKYWEMHDWLFANSRTLTIDTIMRGATELGIDQPQLEACVGSQNTARSVKSDIDLGIRLGVNGTPTIFLGIFDPSGELKLAKRIVGFAPYVSLKEALSGIITEANG